MLLQGGYLLDVHVHWTAYQRPNQSAVTIRESGILLSCGSVLARFTLCWTWIRLYYSIEHMTLKYSWRSLRSVTENSECFLGFKFSTETLYTVL